MSKRRKKYVYLMYAVFTFKNHFSCAHIDDGDDEEEVEDSFIVFCHFALIHTHTRTLDCSWRQRKHFMYEILLLQQWQKKND